MKKIKDYIFIIVGIYFFIMGISVSIQDKIFSDMTIGNVLVPLLATLFGILLCIMGIRNIRLNLKGEALPQNDLLSKATSVVGLTFLSLMLISFVIVGALVYFLLVIWK